MGSEQKVWGHGSKPRTTLCPQGQNASHPPNPVPKRPESLESGVVGLGFRVWSFFGRDLGMGVGEGFGVFSVRIKAQAQPKP